MEWNYFSRRQPRQAVRGASFRPSLEALEDRCLMDASPIAPGTSDLLSLLRQEASQIIQTFQQTVSQEILTVQQMQQQMIQAEEQQIQQLAAQVTGWVSWYTDQNGRSLGIAPQPPSSPPNFSSSPTPSGNNPGSNPNGQTNGYPVGTYLGSVSPSAATAGVSDAVQNIAVTINSNSTATVSIPGIFGGFLHTLPVSITQNADGSWNIQGADSSVDTFSFTVTGNQATAVIEAVQGSQFASFTGSDDPPVPFTLTKQ
jgi:hypothetical protein